MASSETAVSSSLRITMAMTAAALAPELMPMTSGAASGLRSMVWKVMPPRPNEAPASAAMRRPRQPQLADGERGPRHGVADDDPQHLIGPVEPLADHQTDGVRGQHEGE